VFHKRTKLIEFLLQHGANPYKSNKRKQTAMDLAKKNNLTELIEKNVKVEKEKK
jgi:ankyrin repeat protein